MKESIKKYNMWIYSFSKPKYIFVVFITCILEALAISVIPSIINEDYSHTFVKFIVIFIFVTPINFLAYLNQYKKNH